MESITQKINKYKMIRKYNKPKFNIPKRSQSNTQSSRNFKIVAKLDKYRFQEAHSDSQNRYFILDFNEVDTDEHSTYAKSMYEVEFETFYSMISDICSAQLDIQQKSKIDRAQKDLDDINECIKLFIDNYNRILKLEEALAGESYDKN